MNYTDAQSRNLIITDFKSNLFVEAGAGSGKTTSLVSRITAIIIKGLAEIREIAAITFTNEGAADLKAKIQRKLEEAYAAKSIKLNDIAFNIGTEEKDNLEKALTNLALADISTIHKFCLRLLKERPIESNIDPDFDIDTESTLESDLDIAWNTFLLENTNKEKEIFKYILENEIGLDKIKTMANEKISFPDLELYADTAQNIEESEWDPIEIIFNEFISLLRAYLPEQLLKTQQPKAKQTVKDRYNFANKTIRNWEILKDEKQRRKYYLSFKPLESWTQKGGEDIIEECELKLTSIRDSLLIRVNNKHHSVISPLILKFEEYYSEYRRLNSKLNFDDLLFYTRNLLKDNESVREYFKKKYKFLFVDEAQDT
ncbi:MAG: UvrD-helicase domain-containing protein [Ignavibacteriae bacterium]|nr:UvrD-helicase domain-containing protein [Ignavibacteriota bacterium]